MVLHDCFTHHKMRISPIPIVLKGNQSSITTMARPQSSLVGLGSGILDLYSANKLRKADAKFDRAVAANSADFDRVLAAHAAGTEITLRAIGNVGELQIASMHMIQECDTKLQTLSAIGWGITGVLKKKEYREELMASMRIFLFNGDRALDQIDVLTEDYPEYALYQTDRLAEMIEKRDVRANHFDHSSMDEMRLAQEILDRVENTRKKLVSIVEGSDGS